MVLNLIWDKLMNPRMKPLEPTNEFVGYVKNPSPPILIGGLDLPLNNPQNLFSQSNRILLHFFGAAQNIFQENLVFQVACVNLHIEMRTDNGRSGAERTNTRIGYRIRVTNSMPWLL